MKKLTPRMKEKLEKQKLTREIYEKIHPNHLSRTKFSEPKKVPLILPEDFTGKDLKAVKRLMKQREKQRKKEERNAKNKRN